MSQNRTMIDLAANGKAVEFRQMFADQMNAKMAERILFNVPPSDSNTTNANESVETNENENVINEDDDKKKQD